MRIELNRPFLYALLAVILLGTSSFGNIAWAAEGNSPSTHTAVSELQWVKVPFGPKATPVAGDFSKGGHVTFIKFDAGMKTVLHKHTHDYVGIVLTGTTRHWTPGREETEKDLPTGSHWFIPGGLEHVSECLPGVECLMAIYQQESMDFLPVGGGADGGVADGALFAIFDQVNSFDIETATLGVTRGHSEEVRALAAMVLRDHSVVRQMARGLAQKLGIPYEVDEQSEAAQGHAAKMKKLASLSGKKFDKAYLQHEIEFHRSAIDAVQDSLLPSIIHPDFTDLVEAVLPGFEHHLAETEKLALQPGKH